MQNYTNINSRLYAHLFSIGGDNLVAVYVMLKFAKNGAIKINKENNRNIYHTLKSKTNLSVTTLRKYIKILVREELCRFDSRGNFCLIGNNKINNKYKKGLTKVVPLEIGSYKETKLFSFRVRLKRMEQNQKNTIDKRYKLNNIIARKSKGYFTTKQEDNFLKKCEGKLWNEYTAKTILSNQGYSKLKHGEERSKGSGYYWKTKLVEANIVQTKRRFKFLRKSTLSDYLQNRGFDRTVVFKNGKIYKELTPSFTTDIKEPTKQIEKLEHLGFDFLHWWSAQ